MSGNVDQARAEMQAARVPQQHQDALLALKPAAEARGLAWTELLAIVQQYGATGLEILRRLFGGAQAPAPPPQPQPPQPPQPGKAR